MTTLRKLALSAFLSVSALSAVTMTSCNKDDDKTCYVGFSGKDCATESSDTRDKFVLNWSAADKSSTSTTSFSYTCAIVKGSGTSDVIINKTFSDDFFSNDLTATVSGATITIPSQKPDGSASDYSVSGGGIYDASTGQINWTYAITELSTGTIKSHTGTWRQ